MAVILNVSDHCPNVAEHCWNVCGSKHFHPTRCIFFHIECISSYTENVCSWQHLLLATFSLKKMSYLKNES